MSFTLANLRGIRANAATWRNHPLLAGLSGFVTMRAALNGNPWAQTAVIADVAAAEDAKAERDADHAAHAAELLPPQKRFAVRLAKASHMAVTRADVFATEPPPPSIGEALAALAWFAFKWIAVLIFAAIIGAVIGVFIVEFFHALHGNPHVPTLLAAGVKG